MPLLSDARACCERTPGRRATAALERGVFASAPHARHARHARHAAAIRCTPLIVARCCRVRVSLDVCGSAESSVWAQLRADAATLDDSALQVQLEVKVTSERAANDALRVSADKIKTEAEKREPLVATPTLLVSATNPQGGMDPASDQKPEREFGEMAPRHAAPLLRGWAKGMHTASETWALSRAAIAANAPMYERIAGECDAAAAKTAKLDAKRAEKREVLASCRGEQAPIVELTMLRSWLASLYHNADAIRKLLEAKGAASELQEVKRLAERLLDTAADGQKEDPAARRSATDDDDEMGSEIGSGKEQSVGAALRAVSVRFAQGAASKRVLLPELPARVLHLGSWRDWLKEVDVALKKHHSSLCVHTKPPIQTPYPPKGTPTLPRTRRQPHDPPCDPPRDPRACASPTLLLVRLSLLYGVAAPNVPILFPTYQPWSHTAFAAVRRGCSQVRPRRHDARGRLRGAARGGEQHTWRRRRDDGARQRAARPVAQPRGRAAAHRVPHGA
jgi:hypothetical protein